MGIMVHELGHEIFGLADLYDVDYTPLVNNEGNQGAGGWSVMAYGSWGARKEEEIGSTPVLLDAWSKLQMGWVMPIPKRDQVQLIGAGVAGATSENTIYQVFTNGLASEYFLIENRQNQGYDQGLQSYVAGFSGGLAIWHIDDSIGCIDDKCNSMKAHTHPRVYLRTQSRDWLTGNQAESMDLWFAPAGTVLDVTTTPNSKLWSGTASGVAINAISNSLDIMRLMVSQ